MKILVTGASGFLGHHLVDALLVRGHDVVATSSNQQNASGYGWFHKVRYIEYRISSVMEENNLFKFFHEPDAMIHLAWPGLPNFKSLHHFDDALFAQCRFIKNLVGFGLKSLTVAGTCQEYGTASGCLSEALHVQPVTPYAIAKDSFRKYIALLNKLFDFSFRWVRLFYIFGPGQHHGSLIPQLEKALAQGDTTFKMSGGKQIRDYMEVTDVAEALVSISTQNNVLGTINCCSGLPITVEELVKSYLKRLNKQITLELGYYPYPDYEPMEFWGDTDLLKQILHNDRRSN